jgi:uncharacterized SAM-binding protein YcdF (DUF218 family)
MCVSRVSTEATVGCYPQAFGDQKEAAPAAGDTVSGLAIARQDGRVRKRRIVAGVAVGLLILWFTMAGRVLVLSGDAGRADAVIVLSGDPTGRLPKGVEVFRSTRSVRLVIFLSGASPQSAVRDDVTRYLEGQDVPMSAVRLLPPGASTAAEAGAIAGLADRCGWDLLTVVTSPYHTRRAGWLFGRAMDGARITVVPADEPFHSGAWWMNRTDMGHVFLEWIKGIASVRYLFSPSAAVDPAVPC